MSNPINNTQLTVAAIQMNSQQNIEDNLADIKAAIIEAAAQGAQLAVLPENCCSMGRQFATAEHFDALSAMIAEYARTYGMYVLAGSLPCPYRPDGVIVPDGRLRQASLLFAPDGTRIARYDKIHLFTATVADKQGSYNEAATFEPGAQTVVAALDVEGAVYQLGMMVCFDLRFPALSQRLRQAGAELLSAPSAFTYLTGQAHWSLLLQARALDSQCMVIGAAQGGEHAYKDGHTRQTWGHTTMSAYDGTVISSYDASELNQSLNEDNKNYAIVLATLDRQAQNQGRQKMPIFDCHRLA
ncbi:possible carbon-nitrogen hydrolase [Psychrobacter arcticus 273-4]|uniref:Possible carbon-nitrogen hydrolase n=1 Tax=Psychrobacter arcticus (strain DSM 17307 / VKM B-2377 / 273-4) TaxID=259536 RepID=Q4FV83_PSYA2|nr:nitrilase-related carbon-nitrogen hydrolase [Psychrobacter arcticus]AAZ18075.1 possible carbon-nitrogen hydrolase [Psychrobacter arcticus 273-4]